MTKTCSNAGCQNKRYPRTLDNLCLACWLDRTCCMIPTDTLESNELWHEDYFIRCSIATAVFTALAVAGVVLLS